MDWCSSGLHLSTHRAGLLVSGSFTNDIFGKINFKQWLGCVDRGVFECVVLCVCMCVCVRDRGFAYLCVCVWFSCVCVCVCVALPFRVCVVLRMRVCACACRHGVFVRVFSSISSPPHPALAFPALFISSLAPHLILSRSLTLRSHCLCTPFFSLYSDGLLTFGGLLIRSA